MLPVMLLKQAAAAAPADGVRAAPWSQHPAADTPRDLLEPAETPSPSWKYPWKQQIPELERCYPPSPVLASILLAAE